MNQGEYFYLRTMGAVLPYCSHTPACCVSKLRGSIEVGKKQPRVWLQCVYSVFEVFLYLSFGAPLVFLCPPFDNSIFTNKRVQGKLVFNSSSRKTPFEHRLFVPEGFKERY